jgi:anti-sigma regulatory factor (Ser/Thr protein kinase)
MKTSASAHAGEKRRVGAAQRPGTRIQGRAISAEARTELHLPGEPIAPALARAGVRGAVNGVPERLLADLELLVTEVVTNAVRHGGRGAADEIVVRLYAGDCVRVEVVDTGPTFDRPETPDHLSPSASGWGLFLLDRLTTAWGVEAERGGKKVWFELDPGAG